MDTAPTSLREADAPAPMTDAQVEQVGGGFSFKDFPVGCLACTSGGDWGMIRDFKDLVINPVDRFTVGSFDLGAVAAVGGMTLAR
jgi:hypothetical protein